MTWRPASAASASVSASNRDRQAEKLVGGELKIMKRINNYEVCLEASLTSSGTVVGPFMISLIGCPELTPYKGGWCGNDIFHDALPRVRRARARDLTESSARGSPKRATAAPSRSTSSSTWRTSTAAGP